MEKIRIRFTYYNGYNDEDYDLFVTKEQIKLLDWLESEGIIVDCGYTKLDEVNIIDLTN